MQLFEYVELVLRFVVSARVMVDGVGELSRLTEDDLRVVQVSPDV